MKFLPKSLIAPGFTVGFVNVHYPVVAGFLILHLSQHGGGGATAYSAYAGMVLLSRFFLGGLPDRLPPAYTFYAGLSFMAIGISMLAFTTGPVMSIAAAAILGLGFSFPWASVASVVMKRAKSHERGSTVGVLSAFYDAFVGTSSFAAGLLASHFGYWSAFLMALGGVLVAAAVGWRVFRVAHLDDQKTIT
jgi:MFS family permease